MHEPEGKIADEAFLEAVFDRAVDLLSDGRDPSVGDLLAGRDELRERVDEVLRLARELCTRTPLRLPQVPGYEIERELGHGGMGTVYLARQTRVGGRQVALKVLPALATANARARERFVTEIRALSKLAHPNVVAIYDVVQDRDVCAYAMERIEGGSLADVINSGALPAGDRVTWLCRVALAVARALAAAHAAGIVHRDVKPSNILLARDATPLLSDFGLARDDESSTATRSGAFVGTPAYSAPEQLRGDSSAVDARSDVYSLGATLYHALAGSLPYRGRSTTEILAQIERGRLVPLRKLDPRLPRDLETIVAKALESDPARRYPSAAELADDLERLMTLQPIRARRAGWLSRATKLVRRNRATAWGVIGGSAASLALAAALVIYVFFVPRWVDEHVRNARLALLDPGHANGIFSAELWGATTSAASSTRARPELRAALEHYDDALRWSPFARALRDERDTVAAIAQGSLGTAAPDARCAGLAAYLSGDVAAALARWEAWNDQRDALAELDPLIESALGLLYLVRDQPARAYPRLREAVRAFPDVGFLTTYLADAAAQCGDVEAATRWLDAAAKMPHLDPFGAHDRVRAGLFAARGRDGEAEQLYRASPIPGPMGLHYARFLESRGRMDEAAEKFARVAAALRGRRVQIECADALERWWSQRTAVQRRASLRAALDEAPTDPASFVSRCRLCSAVRRLGSSELATSNPRSGPSLVNPLTWFSSPTLESLGLTELAEILEVENMSLWSRIPNCSTELKQLRYLGWSQRWPRAWMQALGTDRRTKARLAAGSLLLGAAPAAHAQCFEGIGDLPGGAFESYALGVSPDGSTVVGQSVTANGIEALRWRAGAMVSLGDLPGGAVASLGYKCNFDGSVIVGQGTDASAGRAVRWDDLTLAQLPQPAGLEFGIAGGVSLNGDVVVGWGHDLPWTFMMGFRIDNGVLAPLMFAGTGGANASNTAGRTSGDGLLVCGDVGDPNTGLSRACYWTGTTVTLLPVLGGGADWSSGKAVSEDGSVKVGASCSAQAPQADAGEPCRWVNDVPLALGPLPGGTNPGYALSCNRDGSVIVGFTTGANGTRAFIWDSQSGMRELALVLASDYDLDLTGWTLQIAREITPDGSVIVGDGINPDGEPEGWIARLECATLASYCTAGTTTNGCNASMSATGTPSIAATSGFTLDCANIEGQKFGLIFYGVSGPKASVWAPGSTSFLCVKAPVQRTASQNSGGTAGACDGSFSIDFLDYLATHPSALGQPFSAGECVNAQVWFRDPPAPGTTNLSNGLQFTTSP